MILAVLVASISEGHNPSNLVPWQFFPLPDFYGVSDYLESVNSLARVEYINVPADRSIGIRGII